MRPFKIRSFTSVGVLQQRQIIGLCQSKIYNGQGKVNRYNECKRGKNKR